MAVASLANRIQVNTNCANNDALYGPYNSIAEAISSIPSALLNGEGAVGRTIGIIENGLVIEYWWQLIKAGDTPSQNQYDFTKKGLSLEDIPEFPDVDGKIEEAISNIEFPDYTKTFEELSEASRNNADNLNLLKDNIFNPDGSVNNNFISTMMLRVGADSMNYHMLKTKTIFNSDGTKELTNGTLTNYSFSVLEEDTLAHFIYTDGNLNGEWKISGGYITSLNPGETYFICLKCNRNNEVGVWECSTTQHKVDEDENYWYFNWGILVYDKDGNYNLIETRGNAYMYGDNLVCGKISTMAGNSYFDLTHGNFVLGDGTGPALSYIDGVLTISGSKGDAEETLRQLGILQGDVEKAQSTADAATQAAEDAKKQAAEEAEQIRKDYAAAIAESEDNMTEALAASVAEINGGIKALQKQVDGEVNSWFMEGEPANNYRPASEWTDQTLKDRHLGDTYTNILPADVDLSTLDSNGTLQWVEQGYLTVGQTNYGKTYAEQRQNASNFCRTKCIMQLANTDTKITITPKDIPSGYTFMVLFAFYNAEKKYFTNTNWQYNSDNSSITYTVPAYGNAWGGTQVYYFSILFAARDSKGNYVSITPSNIASIESEAVFANPEAGKSWRWCNYDDEDNTTFHWHPISDSDAVKALQEAAKAQSTADGKSTTFIEEPKNYDIGDLWILATDRTLNGNTYKQGTILTANAASATFVASHWSEKVKYIDESIAAQQAQQALDGLEIGSRNLVLNSNFTLSAGANTTGTMHNLQFAFDNDLQQLRGRDVTLSMDIKLVNVLGGTTATNKRVLFEPVIRYKDGTRQLLMLAKALSTTETINFTGRISKSFKIADKEIDYIDQKAVYIQGVLSGEASITKPKWEYGTKATDWTPAPEDIDSKADAIKVIADGAAASAKQSNDQLANMSNDSILTPQEKGSVADEWACIQKEYTQNSTNKTTAWGSATVAEWTTYNNAYTTLQTYVSTLALTDRTNNTTIVKSTFQANFANYYSANVAFLNALSKKVAELEVAAMEIGVRNLWAKKYMMDWNDTYDGTATKGSDEYGEYHEITEWKLYEKIGGSGNYNDILQGKVHFEEGKQYCLKVKLRTGVSGTWGGLRLGFKYSDGVDSTYSINTTSTSIETKEIISTKGKNIVGIYCTYGETRQTRIYEIQLVQATKQPNDWLVAPEDVDAAVLEAKESAELANAQLDAIDNDKVIAISERAALETQLEQIQSEYNEITNDMNRYNIDPTNYEKAADKAIEALQYHCGKVYDGTNTAPINADKSITIVAGTSVRYGYGNISAYYTARQTALESIAAAVKASAEQYADNAAQNAADEATGYVDIYTGGNKSHNYIKGDSAKIIFLCNISSNAAYITSVNEDNGSGGSMIGPFGGSCLIAWDKGAGFPVNYYEIFDFGINNVYGVYRWGDTINCPKDAQLLVCLAQYDYISNSVKNNEFDDITYPRNGTWTLNDIKVYTNNALIAQAAMYKAEGLDYLKTALEDGSTEIAGGLTMTNVLMLKNLAGSVTAGMSGLTKHNNKEDKVLMWGGGTYEEAYAAANNDTYNTGSGTITTLLKKDGTGKIGAFWIDKDTIKVVTDSQTTIITNKSVEEAAPLQSTKSISTETKEYSAAVSLSSQGTKTYGKSGSYTQIASYSYTVPAGKYNLNGVLSANYCRAGGTIASGSNSGDVSYSYINGLRIRVVQNGITLATLTGSMSYSQTANYGSSGLQVFSSGSISTGTISSTTSEFSANSGTITIYIEAKVYGYAKLLSGLSGSAHSETEFAFSFLLKGLDKYTVIANDGIAVITNSESQFYINNDSDSLNVKMRGLPTSSTGLSKGDLYTNSSYLRIVT